MSKNKAATISADQAADALERATALAKARIADMDGAEIDDVNGGTIGVSHPTMGFFPTEVPSSSVN